MFTGIIEETAEVLSRSGNRLTVERPASFEDIAVGASVCVAGVCLTVEALDRDSMAFCVVGETLERSKLGALREGDRVNLERSLKVSGRFEGHVVQGHVEGVGISLGVGNDILVIEVPEPLVPFIVPKGSIALDGVSLTVAAVEGNRCTVALIPRTIRETTLGNLSEGDPVNIETDIFVRSLRQTASAYA